MMAAVITTWDRFDWKNDEYDRYVQIFYWNYELGIYYNGITLKCLILFCFFPKILKGFDQVELRLITDLEKEYL